jgi:ribosome-binding factor A
MSTIRQQKVEALVQLELGNFFQREASVYFGGAMITVTHVRMSPDLGVAKVYLSIFSKMDKKEVLQFIISQTKEIRFKLGKEVKKQLRIVPELIFYADDSIDYAESISKLLNKKKP